MRIPPYVEQVHVPRRNRVWSWIKSNALFVALQSLGLAMLPVIMFVSAYFRGYQAIGSEVIICFAPAIYKTYRWLMDYDSRESEGER